MFKSLFSRISDKHPAPSALESLPQAPAPFRGTLEGVLTQAAKAGIKPATVIDVGAAYGTFFTTCNAIYPEASYILLEALEEYRPHLAGALKDTTNTEVVYAAASQESGTITFNVHPDLVGSSLYLENEDSDVNGVPRQVPSVTIDELIASRGLEGPFLLKIDVQGAELDVMAGALRALEKTDYIILEVSFFKFFCDGPEFKDIFTFMDEKGFVVYDLMGPMYRLLDDALSQIDVCFVKKDSAARQHHFYATREQREMQNKLFNAASGEK